MATSGDDMSDEDRLPWLESVEEDYDEGTPAWRIAGLVVVGLALIAGIVFAVHWFQDHHGGSSGNGQLIAAQEGDYKVKPDQPGGMQVGNESSAALATSEGGGNENAAIDLNATPEKPVAGTPAQQAGASANGGSKTAVAAVPASGGTLTAKPPVSAPANNANSSGGGAVVQLGAYPDQGSANAAWSAMSKRFAYLAPLGKSVEAAQVNGKTVYRLRVNAGSAQQADQLCGKLKVAGEACYLP